MARNGDGERGLAALGRGYEDEDEERVVYYDLDAGSGRRNLLLSPTPVPRPAAPGATTAKAREPSASGDEVGRDGATNVLARPKEIFRPQQPLFHLDDSGEEEEEEEGNPFASLLQQQREDSSQHEAVSNISSMDADGKLCRRTSSSNKVLELQHSARSSNGSESGSSAGRHPSLKRKQPPRSTREVLATGKGTTKRLSFEAANSRPARWGSTKPSAVDTNNRRKSLSAIQKRRSQLATAPVERRQSMPAASLSVQRSKVRRSTLNTLNDSQGSGPSSGKIRRLSDVLNRATLLSQQRAAGQEPGLSQPSAKRLRDLPEETPMDGDAILDTELQMRAEPFDAQIFSPTKPLASGMAAGRKAKADSGVPKIRGPVGDAIRKALRKSQRDLTLLRSRGQHLLPQQKSGAASSGQIGAVESVQERPYVVLCTLRRQSLATQSVVYECHIHEAAKEVKQRHQNLFQTRESTPTPRLEALFSTQTAEFLKLVPGQLLKIFEPLHFVQQYTAAGCPSTTTAKWILLGTQLAEVLEENHSCSDGT